MSFIKNPIFGTFRDPWYPQFVNCMNVPCKIRIKGADSAEYFLKQRERCLEYIIPSTRNNLCEGNDSRDPFSNPTYVSLYHRLILELFFLLDFTKFIGRNNFLKPSEPRLEYIIPTTRNTSLKQDLFSIETNFFF